MKYRTELNKSLKLLVNASFIVLLTTILSKILTYLYRVIVARHYDPATYGIYSLSLMIVSWVTVFAGLGIAGGLNRYISYYRGKNEEFKSSYLVRKTSILLLFSGAIGFVVLSFTSGIISETLFHVPELKIFLIIFSISIPFSVLSGIYSSVLKSYEKIGWFAFIVNILQNVVKLVALIFLVYIGLNSKSIAISYVFGAGVALVASYYLCRKKVPTLFNREKTFAKREAIKSLLSYSWPLIFSGLASSIFGWTDTLMIGLFETSEKVGLYNAALPVALLITVSTDLFRQMLLPLITKEYGRGNLETVKALSRQVTKWLFVISIPIFSAVFIFPSQAIHLLFGVEYLSAANALRILSFGFLISTLFDVSPEILLMKGKTKTILTYTIVVGIFNAILNYLFIPFYGINGAALSTTISISLLSIFFTYKVWRKTSILIIKRDVLKILAIGLISFLIAFIATFFLGRSIYEILLSGVIFILIYLGLLYLTRSLDENDLMILNAIKSRVFRTVGQII